MDPFDHSLDITGYVEGDATASPFDTYAWPLVQGKELTRVTGGGGATGGTSSDGGREASQENYPILQARDRIQRVPCHEAFDPPEAEIAVTGSADDECDDYAEAIENNDCAVPIVDCPNCDPGGWYEPECDCDGIVSLQWSPAISVVNYDEYASMPLDYTNMIQAAFNMLQDNDDIVEWIVCLLEGQSNADCMLDALFDSGLTVTFDERGYPENEKVDFEPLAWSTGKGELSIDPNDDTFQDWLARYDDAYATADMPCLIADIAAMLLHELLHGCLSLSEEGGASDFPDERGECDSTYLVESAFRWAISQRFPCIGNTYDCQYWSDDAQWMNDDGAYYPKQTSVYVGPPASIRPLPGPRLRLQ